MITTESIRLLLGVLLPEKFSGKTVLVVERGNSGSACAVEMAREVAKQINISGRGILVYPSTHSPSLRTMPIIASHC